MCTSNRIVLVPIEYWRLNVRVYSFFFASALAATLTFVASGERTKPEPSEPQMELSFRQFFSKLETRPISEMQFTAFKKHSCKPSLTVFGHVCSFSYSTQLSDEQLSILPAHSTFSGTFILDDDGHLRFETVIG
jgi:hypothetical protein